VTGAAETRRAKLGARREGGRSVYEETGRGGIRRRSSRSLRHVRSGGASTRERILRDHCGDVARDVRHRTPGDGGDRADRRGSNDDEQRQADDEFR
jgi:hypothetical protein